MEAHGVGDGSKTLGSKSSMSSSTVGRSKNLGSKELNDTGNNHQQRGLDGWTTVDDEEMIKPQDLYIAYD